MKRHERRDWNEKEWKMEGREVDWNVCDLFLINTKSNSEVKRTSSSLHEEDEFFLCEHFLCVNALDLLCIRSSSERNNTWVNLHHYILTKWNAHEKLNIFQILPITSLFFKESVVLCTCFSRNIKLYFVLQWNLSLTPNNANYFLDVWWIIPLSG